MIKRISYQIALLSGLILIQGCGQDPAQQRYYANIGGKLPEVCADKNLSISQRLAKEVKILIEYKRLTLALPEGGSFDRKPDSILADSLFRYFNYIKFTVGSGEDLVQAKKDCPLGKWLNDLRFEFSPAEYGTHIFYNQGDKESELRFSDWQVMRRLVDYLDRQDLKFWQSAYGWYDVYNKFVQEEFRRNYHWPENAISGPFTLWAAYAAIGTEYLQQGRRAKAKEFFLKLACANLQARLPLNPYDKTFAPSFEPIQEAYERFGSGKEDQDFIYIRSVWDWPQ